MTNTYSRQSLNETGKDKLTVSDCGAFWTSSALKLNVYVPQGSMILALLDNGSYGNLWCLFYEQGGVWTGFGDGEEHNAEALSDWMPEAIESALKEVAEFPFLDMDSVLEDLEWFENWAESAKTTLEIKPDGE